MDARWHQYVFDSKETRMAVFHLHNDHAQRNGEPRQGLYKSLVECCPGGVRILAGDLDMAFWGLIPEMAERGVELHLIANHAEWNMLEDQ